MKDLEKPYIVIVKDNIKHQNIGGKKMIIEKEGTMAYLFDKNLSDITIGEYNFIERRPDLLDGTDDIKIYYGHINGLGYFVSEDEIKEVLDE